MSYDLHQFLTAVKERRGELAYDLKRAQRHVAEIEREIAANETAIANIEAEIQDANTTKGDD